MIAPAEGFGECSRDRHTFAVYCNERLIGYISSPSPEIPEEDLEGLKEVAARAFGAKTGVHYNQSNITITIVLQEDTRRGTDD